jgi:hypothetical protein
MPGSSNPFYSSFCSIFDKISIFDEIDLSYLAILSLGMLGYFSMELSFITMQELTPILRSISIAYRHLYE